MNGQGTSQMMLSYKNMIYYSIIWIGIILVLQNTISVKKRTRKFMSFLIFVLCIMRQQLKNKSKLRICILTYIFMSTVRMKILWLCRSDIRWIALIFMRVINNLDTHQWHIHHFRLIHKYLDGICRYLRRERNHPRIFLVNF